MSLPRRNASRVAPSWSRYRRRRRASGAPPRATCRAAASPASGTACTRPRPTRAARRRSGAWRLRARTSSGTPADRRWVRDDSGTARLSPLETCSLESTAPSTRPLPPTSRRPSSTGSPTASTSSTPAFTDRCFDAAYLIVETRPRRLRRHRHQPLGAAPARRARRRRASAPDAVDYVIATHVHLDHAGGVGLLMQHLPRARLVVHPRGARHLVDPAHLIKSATAVYGAEEIERSYGTLVPVAADRISTTTDGMTHRARRPAAALPRHARPRDAPPLHLGRRQPRLVHRRHLRPLVPRVRHRARRLDHADDDAGAVPARGAAPLDRAHARVSPRLDLRHPLRPRRRRAAPRRRCCWRSSTRWSPSRARRRPGPIAMPR